MMFTTVLERLRRLPALARTQDGQILIEYGLILTLVAVVSFGVVQALGLQVFGLYSKLNSLVPTY